MSTRNSSNPPARDTLTPSRPHKKFTNGERDSKDGPWMWANKSALEKIRTRCEDSRSTLGVYLALCETGSDRQSNDFTASLEQIHDSAKLFIHAPLNELGTANSLESKIPQAELTQRIAVFLNQKDSAGSTPVENLLNQAADEVTRSWLVEQDIAEKQAQRDAQAAAE